MKTAQNLTLVAYALCLDLERQNHAGLEAIGSPVAGWLYTAARFDLWASAFALMAGLWLVCSGAAPDLEPHRRF